MDTALLQVTVPEGPVPLGFSLRHLVVVLLHACLCEHGADVIVGPE